MSEAHLETGTSLWQDAWIRLRKNRLAVFGGSVILFMGTIALLTPWLAPYTYEAQNLNLGPTPPSAAHWLGTDVLGRDLLTRMMYGGRISLMVGLLATAVSLLIGVVYGATAGYLSGRIDGIMMRIVDVMYSLPFIPFVILLMVFFGKPGENNLILLFMAIGAVEWLTMARLVRGQVRSIRKQEFIEASIAIGLPTWTIIRRHMIPNVLGPVIVYTTLTIPTIMLLEAFLSFLGLGVQPPMSSWGQLISAGVETMEEYPWLLIIPGFMLSLTLFALNFLGDGLRDALDPKASKD